MNATQDANKGWGFPCPECGHVLRFRNYVLSGKLMTGGPCPECGVTLYRQYVESRFALSKRAAVVVWPAFIGATLFLVDSMEWLLHNVSPWLSIGIPFLVYATIIGATVTIPYFRRYIRRKQLEQFTLATDVGGWSLTKRRLYRYSAYPDAEERRGAGSLKRRRVDSGRIGMRGRKAIAAGYAFPWWTVGTSNRRRGVAVDSE